MNDDRGVDYNSMGQTTGGNGNRKEGKSQEKKGRGERGLRDEKENT